MAESEAESEAEAVDFQHSVGEMATEATEVVLDFAGLSMEEAHTAGHNFAIAIEPAVEAVADTVEEAAADFVAGSAADTVAAAVAVADTRIDPAEPAVEETAADWWRQTMHSSTRTFRPLLEQRWFPHFASEVLEKNSNQDSGSRVARNPLSTRRTRAYQERDLSF